MRVGATVAQMTFPIVAGELSLTVLVNVGTQRAADLLSSGQPIPRGVWVTGSIDSGTTLSCVSRTVLRQLGLTPVGQGTSQTASGQLVADVYRVSFSIPPYQNLPGPVLTRADVKVMELATLLPGVDMLIGMDLLLTVETTVDGPGGQFTIEF